jgi:pimeloyl-ACP methyl ester carboxylesterase
MTTEPQRTTSGAISILRAGAHSARPLVLLHGIGSNAQSFVAMMTVLASSRPLVAWDAPGYGGSAPFPGEWPSADDYASALAGLLDRLQIGTIDLLGHSMGALVAGRFARVFSKRVARLVLASPALGYGTKPGEVLAPPAASRLDAMISEGAERFAATRGPRLVHASHDAKLVAGVVKGMSEVKLPGYAHASRMLSCADLVGDAAHVTMPTLVLVGAQDQVTPPPNCKRLYDAIAAASPSLAHRYEIIPDAGHAVPQERPQAVADLVAAFAPPAPLED